jgi:hypothetical protein
MAETAANSHELLLDLISRIRRRNRTRRRRYGCANNDKDKEARSREEKIERLRSGTQPGRIIETVNSDNNNNVTRRSHRRVFFFPAPKTGPPGRGRRHTEL